MLGTKFLFGILIFIKEVTIYSSTHQRRKSLPQTLRSQTGVLDLDG